MFNNGNMLLGTGGSKTYRVNVSSIVNHTSTLAYIKFGVGVVGDNIYIPDGSVVNRYFRTKDMITFTTVTGLPTSSGYVYSMAGLGDGKLIVSGSSRTDVFTVNEDGSLGPRVNPSGPSGGLSVLSGSPLNVLRIVKSNNSSGIFSLQSNLTHTYQIISSGFSNTHITTSSNYYDPDNTSVGSAYVLDSSSSSRLTYFLLDDLTTKSRKSITLGSLTNSFPHETIKFNNDWLVLAQHRTHWIRNLNKTSDTPTSVTELLAADLPYSIVRSGAVHNGILFLVVDIGTERKIIYMDEFNLPLKYKILEIPSQLTNIINRNNTLDIISVKGLLAGRVSMSNSPTSAVTFLIE